FRLIEAVGLHPDVSGQVPRRRRRGAALADADAIADGAAALEDTGLPELAQVLLPADVVILGVIVHEKDIFGHGVLPGRRSSLLPIAGIRMARSYRFDENFVTPGEYV